MVNNVLFISVDNLRYDCIGFQPYKDELRDHDALKHLETSALDAIAENSRCYTQCISTNTYTTSSHASILTGLYPPRHGVRGFFHTKLSTQAVTLAELLRDNGYRTILYTDIPYLFSPYLVLDRGFELLKSKDDAGLMELMDELKDEKVFLFAHFFDVHEPFLHNTNDYLPGSNDDYLRMMGDLYGRYGLSDEYNGGAGAQEIWNRLLKKEPLRKRPIDVLLPLYVKGVTKFDRGRFAAFMEGLGRVGFLEDCLQVIFSDHGEGRCFQDNKSFFAHSGQLFDNVIRVPLMISHPGLKPGTDDRLLSTTDIAPTVLSMLGIEEGLPGVDGIDLFSQNRGSCYSEVWMTAIALAELMTEDDRVETETSVIPEYTLSQMAIRTGKSKVVVWYRGDPVQLLEESAQMSDAQFVKALYRELLGRPADPAGLAYHLQLLDKGQMTKEGLVGRFLELDEFKSRRDVRYDLNLDPREDVPSSSLDAEDMAWVDLISEINSRAVSTEQIFVKKPASGRADGLSSNEEEERLVRQMLKDLGYM